jgi:hypothetical protein
MIRFINSLRNRLAGPSRRALPIALAFLIGSSWTVWAQAVPGAGQLAIRSDGFVFWLQDGRRHPVYPAALTDEQLNAFPEGVSLNASLVPAPPPVAPGEVPAAGQPTGSSRADRLNLHQPCICTIIRGTGQQSDVVIQVTNVQRDAWNDIRPTNPSNQLPREGFEYVMISLKIIYANGPRDLPFSADRFDFTLIDANDTLYSPAFVFEPQPLISMTIYPGSEVGGQVAYQIPRGQENVVLVWRYNDDRPVWFAIN